MLSGMRALMIALVALVSIGCASGPPLYCDDLGVAWCDREDGRQTLAFCLDESDELMFAPNCVMDDSGAYEIAPCADGTQPFCPAID